MTEQATVLAQGENLTVDLFQGQLRVWKRMEPYVDEREDIPGRYRLLLLSEAQVRLLALVWPAAVRQFEEGPATNPAGAVVRDNRSIVRLVPPVSDPRFRAAVQTANALRRALQPCEPTVGDVVLMSDHELREIRGIGAQGFRWLRSVAPREVSG